MEEKETVAPGQEPPQASVHNRYALKHKTLSQPKNLICNFRAPDLEHYQKWQDFKKWCQDHGLDICHVTLEQVNAFMEGIGKLSTSTGQIINIQQQNTFIYEPGKPRRQPVSLNCSKRQYSGTISRAAAEAYLMEKARDLDRSFCFRDFLELEHDSFRKIVMRLKKKGKVIPLPERTNPRFFILAEWLPDYPTVRENTTVKQMFTVQSG